MFPFLMVSDSECKSLHTKKISRLVHTKDSTLEKHQEKVHQQPKVRHFITRWMFLSCYFMSFSLTQSIQVK